MSQSNREAIKARLQARLDAMDEPPRRAAIRKAQAKLALMHEIKRAGYPVETKEQFDCELSEMGRAMKE